MARNKPTSENRFSALGLLQNVFYRTIRNLVAWVAVFVFHFRCFGREHTQIPGGALILSTHQSHFDSLLIGVSFNERICPLAKSSLFKGKLLGFVITLLDAIELDRDRSGLAGLKETLKRLKAGKKVLIFPEGTRCIDGKIAPLKAGFLSIARRSRVPLIPVAVAGAFEAMPRGSRLPLRYPLRLAVGPIISADQVAALADEQLMSLVEERLRECYHIASSAKL
jgi:1-acyl-sn-glycerol-3-phosphate acyltransferase